MPEPQSAEELKTIALPEVMRRLQTSEQGLADEEAKNRLKQYGPNSLPEKKINPLLKFLSYFWGPIPWMIEIAAVLSAVVRHWADFIIISLLLFMNGIVGFWEEFQAGNVIAALKSKLSPQARVFRSGQWSVLPARELVPGDLIRIRGGDVIPADARLLRGDSLLVDESMLTGESLPVTRKADEAVYSASVAKQGEMDALAYATGANTFFGKTARMVEETGKESHFQKAVIKIGDYLIMIALALVILILVVAFSRGNPVMTTLEFALVLVVASIPVAMPTVLSVTMAVGARLMAAKQAIVTRLAAIEEMAGIDILCSDKTGTLTENKLTLGKPFIFPGAQKEQLLLAAGLSSRAENQDPIDLAVLSGMEKREDLEKYRIQHFTPFDPVHKRTEATVIGDGEQRFKVTKGAPQVIMQLASSSLGSAREKAEKAVNDYASRGYRSLGVARADGDGPWRFLGILPLFDPPRGDSKETVVKSRELGVELKMVTGDQMAIAKEIASRLGINQNILNAEIFSKYQSSDPRLAVQVEKADGFAQVYPEHKYKIVEILQARNHFVGMTGDGVNDAPALKKAHAGIAVSGATDAARAASDLVLLTPGLSIIVEAIIQSRKIFKRMLAYSIYRIGETVRVLLFMTLAILAFNFYPVTAIMIVLLALLNDGAILAIAYDRAQESSRPEVWNMREVLGVSTVLGVSGVIASFGLFFLADSVLHFDRDLIRTLMYLKLSVAGHFQIFLTRVRGPFWSRPHPAPILLAAVIGTQIIATLISVYGLFMTPIGWGLALAVWGYAFIWWLFNDRAKILAYRLFGSKQGFKPETANMRSSDSQV